MKHALLLIFSLLLVLMACGGEAEQQPEPEQTTPEVTTPESTEPAPAPEPEGYSTLLLGDWQAVDDAKVLLRFTEKERIESYDGSETPMTDAYELAYNCDATAPPPTDGEPPAYIRLMEGDLCWYIISIDKNELELSLVGRGNKLSYKRVQE